MRSYIRKSWPIAIALVALYCGCRPVGQHLTVFVSGDSRGYLEPCGCRRDQAGGLPVRAQKVRAVPGEDRLVLDVGNLTSGGRKYELMKLKYMLQGMKLIGYDAANVGNQEAQLDLEVLKAVVADSPVPLVSCNVVKRADDRPVAEAYRILHKQGLRIGVVGVTACDARDAGPGVRVRPPVEALAETVPKVRKECDFLIVLAYVDEETIRDIASKFHEVDCILGGDVSQTYESVQVMNRASVFCVTGKGKVIGRLEFDRRDSALTLTKAIGVKIAPDKEDPPEDMTKLLDAYKQELRDRRFELASVEGMERINAQQGTADEFRGAAACKSCHSDAHKTWLATAHSKAFETLQRVKSDYDPECLRCHTVGYGLSSGFVDLSKTPGLKGVQCENCHGRGKEHIASKSKSTLKPVTPASCINCHDQENSENFKYASFWPKIAH